MNRREEMGKRPDLHPRQGLTLKALAVESGVPAGTLGFWAWKLRQETLRPGPASDAPRTGFVELVPGPDERVAENRRVEIVLAGGRRVVVDDNVDEDRLVRLVRALERC